MKIHFKIQFSFRSHPWPTLPPGGYLRSLHARPCQSSHRGVCLFAPAHLTRTPPEESLWLRHSGSAQRISGWPAHGEQRVRKRSWKGHRSCSVDCKSLWTSFHRCGKLLILPLSETGSDIVPWGRSQAWWTSTMLWLPSIQPPYDWHPGLHSESLPLYQAGAKGAASFMEVLPLPPAWGACRFQVLSPRIRASGMRRGDYRPHSYSWGAIHLEK